MPEETTQDEQLKARLAAGQDVYYNPQDGTFIIQYSEPGPRWNSAHRVRSEKLPIVDDQRAFEETHLKPLLIGTGLSFLSLAGPNPWWRYQLV